MLNLTIIYTDNANADINTDAVAYTNGNADADVTFLHK